MEQPQQPRAYSADELKRMLDVPKTHKEERAFGWPEGTVRGILAVGMVVGLIGAVCLGMWIEGQQGAQTAASILGAPAGTSTTYYFASHYGKK